jgi:DNA-directed RNA polymerase specialized sigma24 family protein
LRPRLLREAHRLADDPNEAEDLVQECLLAAWQAGADCYLTDPSSPEVLHFLRKLRAMA